MFGLGTQVCFLVKMVMGVYNQARGGGTLPGQEPLRVATHCTRGILHAA